MKILFNKTIFKIQNIIFSLLCHYVIMFYNFKLVKYVENSIENVSRQVGIIITLKYLMKNLKMPKMLYHKK